VETPVSGYCEPRFDAVREAFEANFAERGELGAGVCVLVGGRPVVDLVGGWADEARTRPW
jgi:CubicO group peptidase (beta-lactamase class C family)